MYDLLQLKARYYLIQKELNPLHLMLYVSALRLFFLQYLQYHEYLLYQQVLMGHHVH